MAYTNKMAAPVMFLDLVNLRKERVILDRSNPYDELDCDKFQERFRITKATALRTLSEVKQRSDSGRHRTLLYGTVRQRAAPHGNAVIEHMYFNRGIHTADGAVRCRTAPPQKSSRARLERQDAAN
jgi:hypothetical protein